MTLATTCTALGDIAVLSLTGRVEGAGTRLRRVLTEALADRPQALVVDAGGARLGGLPGVRILIEAAERARAQGCGVVVCRLHPNDARRLAGVPGGSALPTYDSVEAATEGLLLDAGWR